MNKKYLASLALAKEGQALITLIVAAAVAISVLTTAALTAIGQGKSASRNILGSSTYYAAETGAEYALLKKMRDPSSCNGTENITVDGADIAITYLDSGGNCQITSKAQKGDIIKTIKLEASYDQNQLFNYCCWVEIP